MSIMTTAVVFISVIIAAGLLLLGSCLFIWTNTGLDYPRPNNYRAIANTTTYVILLMGAGVAISTIVLDTTPTGRLYMDVFSSSILLMATAMNHVLGKAFINKFRHQARFDERLQRERLLAARTRSICYISCVLMAVYATLSVWRNAIL